MQPSLVKQARMGEIQEFHKHGVYEKVPVRECWEKTGKWVKVNKENDEHP